MPSFPFHDPVILTALSILLFFWATIGLFIHEVLSEVEGTPRWTSVVLCVLCGPAAWAIGLYRACLAARRAILQCYGMGDYTCCGGGCSGAHSRGHGYGHERYCDGHSGMVADRLTNQPAR